MKKVFIMCILLASNTRLFGTEKLYEIFIGFDKNWRPLKATCSQNKGMTYYFVKRDKQFLGINTYYIRKIIMTEKEYYSYIKNKYTSISYPSTVIDFYCKYDLINDTEWKLHDYDLSNNPYSRFYGMPVQQITQAISYMGQSISGQDSVSIQGYEIRFNENGTPIGLPDAAEDYQRHFKDYTLVYNAYLTEQNQNEYPRTEVRVIYKGDIVFYLVNDKYAKFYLICPPNSKEEMVVWVPKSGITNYCIVPISNKIFKIIQGLNAIDPNNDLHELLSIADPIKNEKFLQKFIKDYPNLIIFPLLGYQLGFNPDLNKIPKLKDFKDPASLVLAINQDYLGYGQNIFKPVLYYRISNQDDKEKFIPYLIDPNSSLVYYQNFDEKKLYDGEIVK